MKFVPHIHSLTICERGINMVDFKNPLLLISQPLHQLNHLFINLMLKLPNTRFREERIQRSPPLTVQLVRIRSSN